MCLSRVMYFRFKSQTASTSFGFDCRPPHPHSGVWWEFGLAAYESTDKSHRSWRRIRCPCDVTYWCIQSLCKINARRASTSLATYFRSEYCWNLYNNNTGAADGIRIKVAERRNLIKRTHLSPWHMKDFTIVCVLEARLMDKDCEDKKNLGHLSVYWRDILRIENPSVFGKS
jgi:hypothetical protein